MSQHLDIKEFTKVDNLDKFRFNLSNETNSLIDLISNKKTVKDQSLSEFVTEESIKQLSQRIIDTNDQVKCLQQSMNTLLMQQIQLQKQLIDQVEKNSSMLERVLSMASAQIETPLSMAAVSQDYNIKSNSIETRQDILQDIMISRGKSRLTFSEQSSRIKEETVKKESDLFEDFII